MLCIIITLWLFFKHYTDLWCHFQSWPEVLLCFYYTSSLFLSHCCTGQQLRTRDWGPLHIEEFWLTVSPLLNMQLYGNCRSRTGTRIRWESFGKQKQWCSWSWIKNIQAELYPPCVMLDIGFFGGERWVHRQTVAMAPYPLPDTDAVPPSHLPACPPPALVSFLPTAYAYSCLQ